MAALKRRWKVLLFFTVLFAGLGIVLPVSITIGGPAAKCKDIVLSFDRNSLKTFKEGVRDAVVLKQPGCKYPDDPAGAPALPARFVRVAVPRDAKFEKVTLTSCRTSKLTGKFDVDFVRPPCRPGQAPPPAAPDVGIYGSDTPYPPEKVEFLRAGVMRGCKIFFFRVNPLQYVPSEKELLFHGEMSLQIEYSLDAPRRSALRPHGKSKPFRRMLKKYVVNPADVAELSQDEQSSGESQAPGPAPQPAGLGDDVQYLIICSETFASAFQQLADWKKQKGVPAEVVTVESIETNYTGSDTQEKIKLCIIDYVNDSGTTYVLLGGDINTIPDRDCYGIVNDSLPGSDDDDPDHYIPTDLYYAGLDDIDWNDNGNGLCGEIESDGDTIDLEPDIFVGRYSCKTVAQVDAYVNKVLEYEKEAPATGFCKEILHSGVELWGKIGGKSDAEVWTTKLYDDCIAPYWSPSKTDLFDTTTGVLLNVATFSAAIDNGYGFVNMNTHGNVNVWGLESGSYVTSDAMNQLNDKECGIICTIACITNAFDGWIYGDGYVSLSEGFTRNPNGGAIAYVGSSRYGWGNSGSATGGPSFTYQRTFYEKLLGEGLYTLGEAFTEHKWHNADLCGQYGSYRWLQFTINLMGDPELPIWTDNPQTMPVTYPSETAPGSQTIYIKAEPDSRVCLWKKAGSSDEVYVYGYADETGIYSAVINPATLGTMKLTVTKHNFYPFEADITVTNTPSLQIVTVALPGGQTGAPYSATLMAAGGTPPYSWSDTGGSLPDGLALNTDGTITGTPISTGDSTFTVQVQDDVSGTASREFTITVSIDTPALQDFPSPEYNGNYTAEWIGSDTPTHYELQESSSFSGSIWDDAESGTSQWTVSGFSVSAARYHSASNSFFGGNANNLNSSLTYADPIQVGASTHVSFWRYYDIEANWDYAFFEISVNGGATWKKLKTYTGTAATWTQETIDLSAYAGTSILMRFRYQTDPAVTGEGFYVDDIEVAGLSIYGWTTLSDSISGKWHDITGRAPGMYYYRVRAFEGAATSAWSEIKSVTVLPGALYLDFSVDKSTARPYEDLTYRLKYDNDNSIAVPSFVLEAPVPADTSYVADSAEDANNPHSGASVTVTYYGSGGWHDDTWDNANPGLVEKIRWAFSTSVGADSGGDTEGSCDGPYPDADSGEVTYKVTVE